MAGSGRTKVQEAKTERCGKSKTKQVNIKMSESLKLACQGKADELGISFTDFLAEGAIRMLESNHTEKQRVTIMVRNQEIITQAFGVLGSIPSTAKTEELKELLLDILRGEEEAWQL